MSYVTHWTTQDGRKIPWEDLKDGHLANIIRMLIRGAWLTREQVLVSLLAGPHPSGDGAQECFERELNEQENCHPQDTYYSPSFSFAIGEWKRRGFKESKFDSYHKEMAPIAAKYGVALLVKASA